MPEDFFINLTQDLMLLLRTLTQTESVNRPTADRSWFLSNDISYCLVNTIQTCSQRLLKHVALDASAMKTFSQLKKELKEERAKVKIFYLTKPCRVMLKYVCESFAGVHIRNQTERKSRSLYNWQNNWARYEQVVILSVTQSSLYHLKSW